MYHKVKSIENSICFQFSRAITTLTMARNNRKKSSTNKNKSKNAGQSNKQMTVERNREIQCRLNEEEELEVPSNLAVDDIKAIIAEVESKIQDHISAKNQTLEEHKEFHETFQRLECHARALSRKRTLAAPYAKHRAHIYSTCRKGMKSFKITLDVSRIMSPLLRWSFGSKTKHCL
jgi:hypothetical protein